MTGKLTFLAGAAVGYVLGARAGQERYEQLKASGQQWWSSPGVQDRVSEAGETVQAKAPMVQERARDAAARATSAAKSKIGNRQ